jgi:hypothetical protein
MKRLTKTEDRRVLFQQIRTQLAGWARQGWFSACWSFIGMVSALDTYLINRFGDVLASLEENPVGLFLINLNGGNVSIFIRLKLAGTVLVMSVLAGLYVYHRRWSIPITASVAAFQFGLLFYLVLSSPPRPHQERFAANSPAAPAACFEALRDGLSAVWPGERQPFIRSSYPIQEARHTQHAGLTRVDLPPARG